MGALGLRGVAAAVLPRDAKEVDGVRDEGDGDERDADAVAGQVARGVLGEEGEDGDDAADVPEPDLERGADRASVVASHCSPKSPCQTQSVDGLACEDGEDAYGSC